MLDISSNQLTNIESDVFSGLDRLEELILADNAIEAVMSSTFFSLRNLRHLYLNGNLISVFASDIVKDLKNLESLDLSENRMIKLDARFLVSQSLVYLKMEKNSISTIDDYAFEQFPELRTLRLKNNLIQNISSKAFRTETSSKLQSLDLTSNNLRSFPTKSLALASNLQALYLSKNPIEDLTTNAVITPPYLPKLQTLQLAYVEVANINAISVLLHLSSLQSLLMNNAKLTRVPGFILAFLPHLEILNLDANPISRITYNDFSVHPNLRSFSLSFGEHLTQVSNNDNIGYTLAVLCIFSLDFLFYFLQQLKINNFEFNIGLCG